jgi:hypothetical protein
MNENKPRFAWMHYEEGHNHPHGASFSELGLCNKWIAEHTNVASNETPLLKRRFDDHCIIISQPPLEQVCPCCNPDKKPNQSVMKLDSDLARHLAGAYLAWGMHHVDDVVMSASDLDLSPLDFRRVIDQLRMEKYHWNEVVSEATFRECGIRGVRINCEGDKRFLDRPSFEEVFWPKVMESQVEAPIADKVGLSLIVRQVLPPLVWLDHAGEADTLNYKAALLNPPNQTTNTGTLIVLRKDGKPLHPLHVHALLSYTATKLAAVVPPKDSNALSSMPYTNRLDQVSKEDFEQYYLNMVQQSFKRAQPIPSPYEVEAEEDAGAYMDSKQEMDTSD